MQKPPIIAKVNLMLECGCNLSVQARRLVEVGYVSTSPKIAPRLTSAAIRISRPYQEIWEEIKNRYKGNFIREANRAFRDGFAYQKFIPGDHADEIRSINTSMYIRCGGPMRASYNRSVDELRQAYKEEPRHSCGNHWSVWHGIFANSESDGKQLVGYIQLKRFGEILIYSTILGHGKYLRNGIMPALHVEILSEVVSCGAKWLMYAGWHDGGKGLNLWKRKAGFGPVMFFSM